MLRISTVWPLMVVTMSPGREALPLGMFSAQARMHTRLIGSFSSSTARRVPNTLAAPPMSYFISSMPAPGLRLMPPVSKVMPLPTSAYGFSDFLPPLYCMTIRRGGWALP
ncbi:hypothetical protein D3C76_1486240 [compost metagenome]